MSGTGTMVFYSRDTYSLYRDLMLPYKEVCP